MNKIIFFIKVSIIIAFICSCKYSQVITGHISEVKGDTATVQGYRFKVLENVPVLNQYCTFTGTRNKAKVNCLKLK